MAQGPRLGSKIFYKIGEVSEITSVPAYVLRFWESQFTFLNPKKSRGHQRLYIQRDIETILEIKRLLYEEGMTLAGVKRFWGRRGERRSRNLPTHEVARRLKGALQGVLHVLDSYE